MGIGSGFAFSGAATALAVAAFLDACQRRMFASEGLLAKVHSGLESASVAEVAVTAAGLAGAASTVGIVVVMVVYARLDARMVQEIREQTVREFRSVGVDPCLVVETLTAASIDRAATDHTMVAKLVTDLGLGSATEPVARDIEYRRQLRQVASGLVPAFVLLVAAGVVAFAPLNLLGVVSVAAAAVVVRAGVKTLRAAARYQEVERTRVAFTSAATAARAAANAIEAEAHARRRAQPLATTETRRVTAHRTPANGGGRRVRT